MLRARRSRWVPVGVGEHEVRTYRWHAATLLSQSTQNDKVMVWAPVPTAWTRDWQVAPAGAGRQGPKSAPDGPYEGTTVTAVPTSRFLAEVWMRRGSKGKLE